MFENQYNAGAGGAAAPKKPKKHRLSAGLGVIGAVIAVFVALSLMMSAHTTIEEGTAGIRYRFGEIQEIYFTPGWKWMAPFVDRVEVVDTREQVLEYHLTAYTKDTQTVEDIECQLNFQYDTSQLENIVRNIGIGNVPSKLIDPSVSSFMKNDVGKYKAEELVQNRSGLQEQVEQELREALDDYGIQIRNLNIKNIDFEDNFEAAVAAKVIAEQNAQETKNKTEIIREEANQEVVKATAEADAAKVKADAEAYAIEVIQKQLSASPEYVDYIIAEKWDGKWPEVMGNEVNPFVIMGNGGTAVQVPTGGQ